MSLRKRLSTQARSEYRKLLFEQLDSRITLSVTPWECTLRAALEQSNYSSGMQIIDISSELTAADYIVNSNRDGSDSDLTDGVCWTGEYFASDVGTIEPLMELPAISDPVVLQGRVDENMAPLTQIVGTFAGNANGLKIVDSGSGTYINHLAINRFQLNGILIASSSSNYLSGNFIGTDRAGMQALPNLHNGVRIEGGERNVIGRDQWNVISGNAKAGVSIQSGFDNAISNNYIGTDSSGELPLGNLYGVEFEASAGPNIIGHLEPDFVRGLPAIPIICVPVDPDENPHPYVTPKHLCTNLISGNQLEGVKISGSLPQGSRVDGALIGTDRLASKAVPNGLNGIFIDGTMNVKVRSNRISGNTNNGVLVNNAPDVQVIGNYIGTNFWATTGLPAQLQQDGLLVVDSADALIEDNVISGNRRNGVHLTGSSSNNAKISENNIGMDNLGDLAIANEKDGILIEGNSGGHLIGFHNLISGNKHNGIRINGGTGTRIQGNLIGTNLVTQASRPNEHNGILIEGDASNIVIGIDDSEPPEGPHDPKNIIAGNKWSGIYLDSSVSKARIAGNDIGFEATVPFGNGKDGITVLGPSNTIGSNLNGLLDDEEGNSVRYNALKGVRLQGSTSNSASIHGNRINHNSESGIHIENSSSNKLGRLGTGRNVIWSNSEAGIDIRGSNSIGNIIDGNFIGTESDGKTVPATPQNVGVKISGMAQSNRIGVQREGMFWTQSNVLSGNKDAGVLISNASFNYVYANRIGLGDDMSMVGNQRNGVRIESGVHNEVGHSGNNAYNLISGNDEEGVLLAFGASSNSVRGNFIGYDWLALESEPKPNRVGVRVAGATNNQILDNKIGLNLAEGIVLDSGSSSNTIDRNIVRKNRAGGVLVSNANENVFTKNEISENGKWTGANLDEKQGNGVTIRSGATKNHIGKIGLGNTIDKNFENGVLIDGADENYLIANTIGGEGNWKDGVRIESGSSNQIGAPATGGSIAEGNTIRSNVQTGVFIKSGSKNPVRLNSIYENDRLGIDLYAETDLTSGVTRNDARVFDSDTGANLLQNYPSIGRKVTWTSTTGYTVNGLIDSARSVLFTIDIYFVPTKDSSGFGEGKVHIASIPVQTDAATGIREFTFPVPSWVISSNENGENFALGLTATATDPEGNTSEFSGKENKIFFGIDGTGSSSWMTGPCGKTQLREDRWNSHTKNLALELEESIEYVQYYHGPNNFETGADSKAIHDLALNWIRDKYIASGRTAAISLAGWSRGALIALWVANSLSREGIPTDLVGLYDPVDMSFEEWNAVPVMGWGGIPDPEMLVHSKIDRVVIVGPRQTPQAGNMDWLIFERMSWEHTETYEGNIHFTDYWIRPYGNQVHTKFERKDVNGSHGAIGGTPGYNDKTAVSHGEDHNKSYLYPSDVEAAILSDRYIRAGLRTEGWNIREIADGDYGFDPSTNPTSLGCGLLGGLRPPPPAGYPNIAGNSNGSGEGEGGFSLMAPITTKAESGLPYLFTQAFSPLEIATRNQPASPLTVVASRAAQRINEATPFPTQNFEELRFMSQGSPSVQLPTIGGLQVTDSRPLTIPSKTPISVWKDVVSQSTGKVGFDASTSPNHGVQVDSDEFYRDEVWKDPQFVLGVNLTNEEENVPNAQIVGLYRGRRIVSKSK